MSLLSCSKCQYTYNIPTISSADKGVFLDNKGNFNALSNRHSGVIVLEDGAAIAAPSKLVCAFADQQQSTSDITDFSQYQASIASALDYKPTQRWEVYWQGLTSKYIYFGYRKDRLTSNINKYCYNKGTADTITTDIDQDINKLISRMELIATNTLQQIIPNDLASFHQWQKQHNLSNASDICGGIGTQLAIGSNYISPCHTDKDCFYSILSVMSGVGTPVDSNSVLYFFVFPEHKIKVPMRAGDVIVFNPATPHCSAHTVVVVIEYYRQCRAKYTAVVNVDIKHNKV